MATIRENQKNGKIISYRFTVCLERDTSGMQVRRYTTYCVYYDIHGWFLWNYNTGEEETIYMFEK